MGKIVPHMDCMGLMIKGASNEWEPRFWDKLVVVVVVLAREMS